MLSASRGSVVLVGSPRHGKLEFAWPSHTDFEMVSCGWDHTVLLHSDGTAYAFGGNQAGQCDLPGIFAVLPMSPGWLQGNPYRQVSAGGRHTVLLRWDGMAVACGLNNYGQCNIPELPEGLTYTQISAGVWHTVLLRGDGVVVTCGLWYRQIAIPVLPEGMTYTQISAGYDNTLLLRSDGMLFRLAEPSATRQLEL